MSSHSSSGAGVRAAGRLREAPWLNDPATVAVFRALQMDGHEVRIVGGAVRNALLGEPVKDIDMATDARPEVVLALAARAGLKAVPTGLQHGTVTVVSNHAPYEVTTLRKDVETFGRHARVDFTGDWAGDAKRRDFTINALFCEADGTVVDHVGGLEDLAARRVRFIGSAADRIREDYLRILRFFRFTATYGDGEIDSEGLRACVAGRAGLARLSGERIHAELTKLLVARKAVPVLDVMLGHGLIADLVGVPRLTRFARVAGLEQALGAAPDPALRLGALAIGAEEDAQRLLDRLKLPGHERDRLFTQARTLHQPFPADVAAAEQLHYRMGAVPFRDRLMLAWAQSGAAGTDPSWLAMAALARDWVPPVFPVRGRDLIALGAEPGPALGGLLTEIEDAWVGGGFTLDRASLLDLARQRLAATQ